MDSAYLTADLTIAPAFMASTLVPMYVGDSHSPSEAAISPLKCEDVGDLCPQLVTWGSAEVLQCDAREWAKRCHAAGVEVETYVGHGGLHCFCLGGLASSKALEREGDKVFIRWIAKHLQV